MPSYGGREGQPDDIADIFGNVSDVVAMFGEHFANNVVDIFSNVADMFGEHFANTFGEHFADIRKYFT